MIRAISFTDNGDEVNKRLMEIFGKDIECFGKGFNKRSESLSEWTKKGFDEGKAIIFIGAVGIAVRAVSKYITSKERDSAVVCIDELGRFVIPILSGHIGGANEYAEFIAERLGSTAVITTATDINGIFAFDTFAYRNNMLIEDIKMIKHISSALLSGKSIGIRSFFELGSLPKNVYEDVEFENGVCISPYIEKPYKNTLNIIPKCIAVGIGCKKDIPFENVYELFDELTRKHGISPKAVSAVATIDIKKDEYAIKEFCRRLGTELKTFSASELNEVKGSFSSSEFVSNITGTDNVCERSAVKLSEGDIILPKTSKNGVTMAFAVKKRRIDLEYKGIWNRLQTKYG